MRTVTYQSVLDGALKRRGVTPSIEHAVAHQRAIGVVNPHRTGLRAAAGVDDP